MSPEAPKAVAERPTPNSSYRNTAVDNTDMCKIRLEAILSNKAYAGKVTDGKIWVGDVRLQDLRQLVQTSEVATNFPDVLAEAPANHPKCGYIVDIQRVW